MHLSVVVLLDNMLKKDVRSNQRLLLLPPNYNQSCVNIYSITIKSKKHQEENKIAIVKKKYLDRLLHALFNLLYFILRGGSKFYVTHWDNFQMCVKESIISVS